VDHCSQNNCGCQGGRNPRNMPGSSCGGRMNRTAPGNTCPGKEMSWHSCAEAADFPIGMAYVPWQTFRNLYSYEKALCVGSIFQELDKPFMIGRCARR
jgi:hypothetical protein